MEWRRFIFYLKMIFSHVVTIAVGVGISAIMLYAAMIITIAIFAVVDITIPLLTMADIPKFPKVFLLVHVFVNVYLVVRILQPLIILIAKLIIVQCVILVTVEMIVDEVISYAHSFDTAPSRGVKDGKWELVTTVRSSNNGSNLLASRGAMSPSGQFYPVIICDSNLWEDPFCPEHASLIHVVEIRRRTTLWKELIIWRVSMLNGGQKMLATLQTLGAYDIPFRRHYDAGNLHCFQSANTIIIAGADLHRHDLFVYDIRFKKWGFFTDFARDLEFGKLISITCLERLIAPNGALQGWRMRVLMADAEADEPDEDIPENEIWRSTMSNAIVELRIDTFAFYPRVRVLSLDTVEFGNATLEPDLKVMRTSDGLFGVYAEDLGIDNGPVLFYDAACRVYVYCADFQEAQQLDRRITAYVSAIEDAPNADLCPVVFNQRECIEGFANGALYRLQLAPTSLKYLAAKRLFESNPDLRIRSTAKQLQQLTGIQGMDGHFG